MIKYIIFVLALTGGYYYFSRYANLESGQKYVQQHKDASWAPRAQFTIAFLYHEREEYPKAQEAFTQLLTDYPTCQFSARGLVYLDDAAESNHDWDAAKAALDRYIEEHPDDKDIGIMKQRRELLHYHHGI